jgi:hypothetical protein
MLGSYHMSNPGADMFNLKADDVLAPKRQAEIQALVDRLAKWAPTKIAIEAPFGDSLTKARYHAYLRGEHELRKRAPHVFSYVLKAPKLITHRM